MGLGKYHDGAHQLFRFIIHLETFQLLMCSILIRVCIIRFDAILIHNMTLRLNAYNRFLRQLYSSLFIHDETAESRTNTYRFSMKERSQFKIFNRKSFACVLLYIKDKQKRMFIHYSAKRKRQWLHSELFCVYYGMIALFGLCL